MRSLNKALQAHELIVLRVIGEWWDLDLTGSDKSACVKSVAAALLGLDLPQEISFLPVEETTAFMALVAAGGRVPVAAYQREHGEVRMMGPGRLEREEPWFDPVSPAEALWYRGFLYRGFDETPEGMIEFYFLPDEFCARFPQPAAAPDELPTALEAASLAAQPAPDTPGKDVTDCVDDITTMLLLAQQTSLPAKSGAFISQHLFNDDPERWSLLVNLALEMGLITLQEEVIRPLNTAVPWLKKSREAQLRALAEAWSSSSWNELCHTPGLQCEGDQWHNDPILARTTLFDALPRSLNWFRLQDLVARVKESDPDFQRPDGNYDTWYIREKGKDVYLDGFESWDQVEGRLLPFLVQGPMVWLGLAVTAVVAGEGLFSLTDRTLEWLQSAPPEAREVNAPLIVQADATVLVPHNASRFYRFQVGRVSESYPYEPGKPYRYRITPRSLARANQQGITPERILKFLKEASGPPLPPSAGRGIERWAAQGVEGRLEAVIVLRVRDESILKTLRQNPKTRDYLGESLGELAVAIAPQSWEPLRKAVAQLGLLLDVENI